MPERGFYLTFAAVLAAAGLAFLLIARSFTDHVTGPGLNGSMDSLYLTCGLGSALAGLVLMAASILSLEELRSNSEN